jgi:hypothetical protein
LLAKPETRPTIASNWPGMLDELASAETIQSLIVQYLILPYYIPDRGLRSQVLADLTARATVKRRLQEIFVVGSL